MFPSLPEKSTFNIYSISLHSIHVDLPSIVRFRRLRRVATSCCVGNSRLLVTVCASAGDTSPTSASSFEHESFPIGLGLWPLSGALMCGEVEIDRHVKTVGHHIRDSKTERLNRDPVVGNCNVPATQDTFTVGFMLFFCFL